MRPVTAVVPAAGRGKRLLPATKAIPKEILPLGTVPALQYILAECLRAGVERLVLVVNPEKEVLRRYLTPEPLEAGAPPELVALEEMLAKLDVVFVNQEEPLGLGHAVLMAEEAVAGAPFLLLLPDELYPREGSGVERLLPGRDGEARLLLRRVARRDTARYGIVAGVDDGGEVAVTRLVEKPRPEEAPSDLAIMGRYLLPPSIFTHLRTLGPGAGGEIQLTDGIAALLAAGGRVAGIVDDGLRLDLGDRAAYEAALIHWLGGSR
jgi:UTP--glucose-1-phosphate uridylyltransferase